MQRTLISLALVTMTGGAAMTTASVARAEGTTTTTVTTYVTKTQDERESTRWTLTEWLRIKERMKMMDVWLALFSDPKKDKFQPELMLNYDLTRGKYHYQNAAGSGDGSLNGTKAKAQLWLTNIISSSIGVRTLNIDLGGEGELRQTSAFTASSPATAALDSSATAAATPTGQKLGRTYYAGDLRIFGKNIQDSSIVLKYGRYTLHNEILDQVQAGSGDFGGIVAGAELQLYLFKFLGAEANYLRFGNGAAKTSPTVSNGEYYDYMGFIEISLLRLTAGIYGENWSLPSAGGAVPLKTQEHGTLAGIKLSL